MFFHDLHIEPYEGLAFSEAQMTLRAPAAASATEKRKIQPNLIVRVFQLPQPQDLAQVTQQMEQEIRDATDALVHEMESRPFQFQDRSEGSLISYRFSIRGIEFQQLHALRLDQTQVSLLTMTYCPDQVDESATQDFLTSLASASIPQ